MAMGTERSKALHNFTMPCELRWGSQRFLRCMKVNNNNNNNGHVIHRSSDSFLHGSSHNKTNVVGPTLPRLRRFSDDDDEKEEEDGHGHGNGIGAVRERVMLDIQTSAEKMKESIFKDGEEGEAPASPSSRPWNLRTRRAACRTPASGKGLRVDVPKPMGVGVGVGGEKSPRLMMMMMRSSSSSERRKFSMALTKREIEEDFVGMVGRRPPRRPKKRAKNVQKQLDLLFPGVYLTEITPDMYKVTEPAP